MANAPKSATRIGLIERVTTPLGFFTLGILVIEAILGSLSLRVSGMDLTILIVGMLLGFGLLCGMVFVLATFPQFRSALLGIADHSPSSAIVHLNLTSNDILVLHAAYHLHGFLMKDEMPTLLGDSPLPWPERIQRLHKLGLIELLKLTSRADATLTNEGRNLASLIEQFYLALAKSKKSGRTI